MLPLLCWMLSLVGGEWARPRLPLPPLPELATTAAAKLRATILSVESWELLELWHECPLGVCGLDTRLLQLELFEEVVVVLVAVLAALPGGLLRSILLMLLLVRKLPSVVLAGEETVVYRSGGRSRILCVSMCCFMFPLVEKPRSQTSHLKGRSLVCERM